MQTTDKPTTTASASQNCVDHRTLEGANTNSAPKGVRDKTYKYFGVSKAEYDAAQTTSAPETRTKSERKAERMNYAVWAAGVYSKENKRTSDQLAAARKHLPDIDATLEAMRTIPAEKPTAIMLSTEREDWTREYKKLLAKVEKAQAHAAQLAEAGERLKNAVSDLLNEPRTLEIEHYAETALHEWKAAYESEVRS